MKAGRPTDPLPEDLRWLQDLARSLLGDQGLADDACQETWLAAHRKAPGWRPPRPWLAEAMRRIARGLRRRAARRSWRELAQDPPESPPSPDELVARSELQRKLLDHLLVLPEPIRTTTLLRYQEGWTVERIAVAQGRPADTVRWRLRRALALIRQRCQRDWGAGWRDALAVAVPASLQLARIVRPAAVRTALWSALMINTKTLVWSVAAAMVLGSAALFFSHDRPAADLELAGARDPDAGTMASRAAAGMVADRPTEAPRQSPARAPVEASASTDAVLLGRVVDQTAAPLGAVTVRAQSSGRWRRQVRTADDGSFRLAVPVEERREVRLEILPDPFHTSLLRWFGGERQDREQPLAAGEHDLGELRVEPAGAVRGRVVGPGGRGQERALAHVVGSGEADWSAADGSFFVPHVRPGKFELRVESPGLGTVEQDVEVVAGRECSGIVVGLSRVGTLAGFVVDEAGAGVAGVHLRTGWGYSYRWCVETGPKGEFRLGLARAVPVPLVVEDVRYEQLDRRRVEFAPNIEGIRLTVRKVEPATRFVVVDAETGAPVMRYWAELLRHAGPRGTPALRDEIDVGSGLASDHPGGAVTCPARPGIDCIAFHAAGYLDWKGVVRHDEGAGAQQTVRLVPAHRLSGRVLRDGVPVEGARVSVQRCGFHKLDLAGQAQRPRPDYGGFRPAWISLLRVEPLSGSVPAWQCTASGSAVASTRTDAGGRFAFGDLSLDACMVTIRDDRGPPLCLGPIRVSKTAPFGDLELPHAVVVQGSLDLAQPAPLDGHHIRVAGRDEIDAVTDARGRFRFEAAAGDLVLRVVPGPGMLIQPPEGDIFARYFVRVPSARTLDVVLPVHNVPTCELRLRVRSPFDPGDLDLILVPLESGKPYRIDGSLDDGGELRATVPVLGRCWPEAVVRDRRFRLTARPVHADRGAELRVDAELTAGTLEIHCPTWPQQGACKLALTGSAGAELAIAVKLPAGGTADPDVRFSAGTLSLLHLPAGAWSASAQVIDAAGATLWKRTGRITIAGSRAAILE